MARQAPIDHDRGLARELPSLENIQISERHTGILYLDSAELNRRRRNEFAALYGQGRPDDLIGPAMECEIVVNQGITQREIPNGSLTTGVDDGLRDPLQFIYIANWFCRRG